MQQHGLIQDGSPAPTLVQAQGLERSSMTEQQATYPSLDNPVGPHVQQVVQARTKGAIDASSASSAASLGSSSVGVLIPGAQSANRSGYIHVSEDPSAQSHALWCSKCQHVKPERAHHCRVCKRCVLKMDHHCPWVLNCVGQDNYKFFVLFVAYTAIHCVFILVATIPVHVLVSSDSWTQQLQIVMMVIAGVFGLMLVVFTVTHIRLIFLNRTTIEDHSTPITEGPLPCLRKGWSLSEGENNQGNERLFDLGIKDNWKQCMGEGWKSVIPVRFPRPEGPIYNQKVVARQWKDYYQQMEVRRQQELGIAAAPGQAVIVGADGIVAPAPVLGQQQQPQQQQGGEEITAVGTGRLSSPGHDGHAVHHRFSSGTHLEDQAST
ncbi:hypothetical protein BGZ99_008065 [Dissophora globulifera]|uniref:Palmitoyltransferase n=1 Tax=Dissophora globulifera TaxID=979702 RepID=A0A9P6RBV2_9FUNG|nr:hypothetical protein BGZ99_008065 [Dissophora globulifera]